MKNAVNELIAKGKAAKAASRKLGYISTEIKNQALQNIAADLRAKTKEILTANKLDTKAAAANGINETMQDRLLLNMPR